MYPLGLGDVEKFCGEYLRPPLDISLASRGIQVLPLDIDECPCDSSLRELSPSDRVLFRGEQFELIREVWEGRQCVGVAQ